MQNLKRARLLNIYNHPFKKLQSEMKDHDLEDVLIYELQKKQWVFFCMDCVQPPAVQSSAQSQELLPIFAQITTEYLKLAVLNVKFHTSPFPAWPLTHTSSPD